MFWDFTLPNIENIYVKLQQIKITLFIILYQLASYLGKSGGNIKKNLAKKYKEGLLYYSHIISLGTGPKRRKVSTGAATGGVL